MEIHFATGFIGGRRRRSGDLLEYRPDWPTASAMRERIISSEGETPRASHRSLAARHPRARVGGSEPFVLEVPFWERANHECAVSPTRTHALGESTMGLPTPAMSGGRTPPQTPNDQGHDEQEKEGGCGFGNAVCAICEIERAGDSRIVRAVIFGFTTGSNRRLPLRRVECPSIRI